jgi:hypothetical protein
MATAAAGKTCRFWTRPLDRQPDLRNFYASKNAAAQHSFGDSRMPAAPASAGRCVNEHENRCTALFCSFWALIASKIPGAFDIHLISDCRLTNHH